MKVLAVFALLFAVCAMVQAQRAPIVGFYSDDRGLGESSGSNWFTFYREGDANETLSFSFLLSGTATFGVDYGFNNPTVRPGLNTLTFEGNATTTHLILNIINDRIEESTETVTLEIQESARYTIDSNYGNYTFYIYDDDELPYYYVYSDDGITTLDEDSQDYFLVAFEDANGSNSASLTFTVSGTATLNEDYEVTGAEPLGGGRFRASNSDGPVYVGFRQITDGVFEADETIQISIDLSDDYTILFRTLVLTIVNDDVDTLPIVSVDRFSAGSSISEDAGVSYSFSFYRDTSDVTLPLTVSFRVGGTAVYTTNAATDYTVVSGASTFSATRGTVVIPAGSYSQAVVIRPKADFVPEDDETIEFTLIENVLFQLDSSYSSSTVVIVNDDGYPTVSVATVGTASVTEGAGQITFRFTRVGPTSYPLEVFFSLLGTAGYPADYVVSGASLGMGYTVLIPTNALSFDVLVSARSDVLLEPRETVIVQLESSWGSSIYNIGTPSTATGFIIDSPPALPVLALVGDESITEGQTKSYRITRSGILTGDIVVVLSFTGTATIKNDYTVAGGILTGNRLVITMPAGKSYIAFSVAAIHDFIPEETETITVDLVPQSRYIVNPAATTKTISIIDYDNI